MNNAEFQQHAEKIEQLVQRVNAISNDDARTMALELMQSLMDLHGAGITRIVEVLSEAGESGRRSLDELGRDPLICGLLVLYGVHPVSLEQRVTVALQKLVPQLRKQGGSVDLLSVDEGLVRVSIQGSGNGCHSSPDALKSAVEQAIREAAPEVIEVIAEGVPGVQSGFVPLNNIQPASSEENKYEESAA
jgi:Fe-S cluster biogenesis protein NfuA